MEDQEPRAPEVERPDDVSDRQEAVVCVAVDGSRAARQAVLWGAVEARLRHTPLLVVHVEVVATESVGADSSELSGRSLLESSAEAASQLEPDLHVRTELLTGTSVRAELGALSQRAVVLALGIDPTRPRWAHGGRGPIEDHVAVHARCPVVTVAPRSFLAPGARSQVTVGWTEGHTARIALEAAAEEAQLRGAALTVLTVPPVRDPQLAGIIPPPDQESALIDAVGVIEDRYPGLPININHQADEVTAALKSMAPLSELLVLGCHHSNEPWSIRTGPVAAALMRDGHCPVMLVGRLARQRADRPASQRSDQHSTDNPVSDQARR
jgi:nucleotide-binding universal stress UspA family protein